MAQSSSIKRFSRAERVYRALLWVYPADFRREYAAPMAQLFRDLCRDAYSQHGRLGLAQMWGRVLADTAIAAVIERIYTLQEGAHTMSKQQHRLVLFFAGFPLGLAICLTVMNPRFMLRLLTPNAAQPVGWLMTAAIVGLSVAVYFIQRTVFLAATPDAYAGVKQTLSARYRLFFAGSLLFLAFPALLLVLLGPAFITLLLSGVLR